MAGKRPEDPGGLLGVYRSLGDVPDRHRLEHHEGAYDGRDAWDEFATEVVLPECDSEGSVERLERHERRWKAFIVGRGRHHALARPGDVDAYSAGLLASNSGRVAAEYFRRLAEFYDYLMTSVEHPHVYSPVLMAAAGDGPAANAWATARAER